MPAIDRALALSAVGDAVVWPIFEWSIPAIDEVSVVSPPAKSVAATLLLESAPWFLGDEHAAASAAAQIEVSLIYRIVRSRIGSSRRRGLLLQVCKALLDFRVRPQCMQLGRRVNPGLHRRIGQQLHHKIQSLRALRRGSFQHGRRG